MAGIEHGYEVIFRCLYMSLCRVGTMNSWGIVLYSKVEVLGEKVDVKVLRVGGSNLTV